MSNLLYLALALALSVIGISVLWFRTRRPRSMTAHIEEFARELDALAPERSRRRGPASESERRRSQAERETSRATRERPSG